MDLHIISWIRTFADKIRYIRDPKISHVVWAHCNTKTVCQPDEIAWIPRMKKQSAVTMGAGMSSHQSEKRLFLWYQKARIMTMYIHCLLTLHPSLMLLNRPSLTEGLLRQGFSECQTLRARGSTCTCRSLSLNNFR